MNHRTTVRVWTDKVVLPTYLPAAPDKNPMFLEKRVYQGSSGRVYPLPFTDRIAEKPVDRGWQAVWIENEFLRAMVLPEIGGRIHVLQDKTNGYDLIYRQEVIKPALVGLAGPWISGGIEFNWPQHHRPATFLPVDFEIEDHADGSKTIWCSDHDPMARMKGMHGVCLHAGRAYLELKVRVCNRTPFVQTFLWWANVATRVHEGYQSFFPPDVHCVADHAKRATSEYPLCQGRYYGVNYGARGRRGVPQPEVPANLVPPHGSIHSKLGTRNSELPRPAPNDLSFYANIPVPTSYMCLGSREDFFGGYDHVAQAGIVHIANHHLAPGKKQWTWGNHEFGYAWDRNLTDPDTQGEYAPYIELMAGAYTDNQPDFSFLQPGETKTWSQYWYPIQKIGPAQHANLDAAVSLRRSGGRKPPAVQVGIAVTAKQPKASVSVLKAGKASTKPRGGRPTAAAQRLASFTRDLSPAKPWVQEIGLPKGVAETDVLIRVADRHGRELISYQPKPRGNGEVPPPATEPPVPRDIASADELFITGLHLEQYRHATRGPTPYWREALRRDPLDARCNNALGLWHLHRGEFAQAETHFRRAVERLTRRNPNPRDGEPYYNLGLCLRYQADALVKSKVRTADKTDALRVSDLLRDAYAAFYKATWNQAWAGAAYHALAEMDCLRRDWARAGEHAQRACQASAFNQRAMNLWALAVRHSGDASSSEAMLRAFRRTDPLDWWTRHLLGETLTCDLQTRLDIAHDYARAGFFSEAIELLSAKEARASTRSNPAWAEGAPMTRLTQARDSGNGVNAALPNQSWGAAPLVPYTLGWLYGKRGDARAALKHYRAAAATSPDYCFPARLEELAILEAAMRANPQDARAPYYLGNWHYDRRRHEEAIRMWERSAKLDPSFSIVWRNLGLGYFNIRRQPVRARAAYDRAFACAPQDARLLYERDQLWKRAGVAPPTRLRALEKHLDRVRQRDDLSVELCALYNQVGQPDRALAFLGSRHFQPWEGGEGGALGQYVRAHLALGREALRSLEVASPRPSPPMGERVPEGRGRAKTALSPDHRDACPPDQAFRAASEARAHFESALRAPRNLGEAKHLLANQSDIQYWLGCACDGLGDRKAACRHWRMAATFQGDFQEMSVRTFSEMTYYRALAWGRLGQPARMKQLLRGLLAYAKTLQKTEAQIDYFATSLPAMLLFEDDIQFRQETYARFLQAQAHWGLGRRVTARALLASVLQRDPNHMAAADFAAPTSPARGSAGTPRPSGFRVKPRTQI